VFVAPAVLNKMPGVAQPFVDGSGAFASRSGDVLDALAVVIAAGGRHAVADVVVGDTSTHGFISSLL
jgi:hypothetical protein